jgi:hypothetical protein
MRYLLAFTILTACGYPPLDDGNGTSDANKGDGKGSACDASASYGTPTLVDQGADHFPGTAMQPEELQISGRMTNEAKPDLLFVDLVETQTDPIATGTFNLGDNFGNCRACVLVIASCDGTNCSPFDPNATSAFYLATQGTLKITSLSPMAGTLTNAKFQHVSIDNSGSNPTGVSTPINDGCTSAVTMASFSATPVNH